MFAVSARNTAKGYQSVVEDNGIDLSRKGNIPPEVLADPIKNMGWQERRRRLEVTAIRDKAQIRELRRVADEAIERANRMAAQLHAMERQIDGIPTLRIPFARIERRICKALRVTVHEIHSKRRVREIVFARQAVMYWAIRLTLKSYPEVGRLLGGRDHTTVLHGVKSYPEKRAAMGRKLRPAR